MRVIVITGGIGAGKSTAADFLRQKGAVVLDADRIAAHMMEKGSPVLARVVTEFGDDILYADGSLDRPALARLAFESAAATARLNSIVHPAVAREVGPALTNLRLLPDPPALVVIEVPLLAEAPVFAELADNVIAIVAPQDVRLQRAIFKGMTESDARRRMAVQATDAERAALADIVIVNDAGKERFVSELERIWEERLAVGGGR